MYLQTKIKVTSIIAFAVFAGAFLVPKGLMQTQTQTPPASQVETAGQKFKNIKVLNEMPADQLGKVMNLMSASLGFNCAGCHISGDKDFDKDGNQHKEAARKMIRMTWELNKQFFDGKPEVSCNTCHNGHERPVALPNLNPVAAPEERPKQPDVKPTIDQILDKYTTALGGKENLAKVTSRTIKASRVEPGGKAMEPESIWQKSGKLRVDTAYPNYLVAEIFDGKAAWKRGNKEEIILRTDESEQIKREAQLFANPDLKGVFTKLDFRFVDRIDGKEVYLVIGSLADNTRERLYFDATTGLLVRRNASSMTVLGAFQYQVDYSDYKDFGGVKLPATIRFAVPSISWTRKIIEVKNNASVDDKMFVK